VDEGCDEPLMTSCGVHDTEQSVATWSVSDITALAANWLYLHVDSSEKIPQNNL